MLRRLNVRTRLIAVIAVPLVLLLAVAVPEVLERRGRAAEARQAAAVTAAVDEVAAATDSVQRARSLAAARRAGADDPVSEALAEARTTTDAAFDRARSALGDLTSHHPDLDRAVRVAGGEMDRLEQVRAETDSAESVVAWDDPYAAVTEALLDVQEAAAAVASDLGVGEGLTALALLARTKEATAAQAVDLAAAATWGELRGEQADRLSTLRSDEAAYRSAYLSASPSASRDLRRDELLTSEVTTAGRVVDGVIAGGALSDLSGWLATGDARQQVLRDLEADRAAEALSGAEQVGADATRASRVYLAVAGSGLLLALVLALAAARSITRPLRALTDAADVLAADRLPKLLDALRHPVDDDEHYLSAAMEPIPVRSEDELGRLAQAFNLVQSVAVDVAAEQAALLKKGISDLYVNLARRNQALLERQIQHLDTLEQEEQDAEVLEHLYLLDHLATRMRRNAESLLVLAGAESGPRRSKPSPLVDVVRAAVSEVEEYERIELGALADATLHGPAVSDVAHIVAELIENASHFSPPETSVRVDGARNGGSYQLVITDEGVGMPPEQLEELNAVLRDPPVTGLALGRSLGCLVAARLAARHGITVRLRTGVGGGVAAYVILPRHLLVDTVVAAPVSTPERALHTSPALPATLQEALPRADFEAGLQALLDRDQPVADPGDEPVVAFVEPSRPEPIAVDEPVALAMPTSEPAAHPLTRRVPGATTEPLPEAPAMPPARRDPDQVRALLSRYRSGLEAGRRADGPADEERS